MNTPRQAHVSQRVQAPGGAPRSRQTLWEARTALAGLSAVFLFEMLDNSILNVALPTIGRDLRASTSALQLVTSAYAVVFGGLMLALSALADHVGRRKIMLVGLVLLGAASLATSFVTTVEQLIVVRAAMGVAAAMTTPGSFALVFRLFEDDGLRVRATTLISTVGLVELAVGPTVGGLVLSFAPWQVLLVVNVPIAALAFACIGAASAPTIPMTCTATPSTGLVHSWAPRRSCSHWSSRPSSSTPAAAHGCPGRP